MLANKIIYVLITASGFVLCVLVPVSTLILGLLVLLPLVGLLLHLAFSLVWAALFLGPLLGTSLLWLKVPLMRPLLALVGIPIAVIGEAYVSLIPSMGDMDGRLAKLLLCETWPFTLAFFRYRGNPDEIGSELKIVLDRVSWQNPLFKEYLARRGNGSVAKDE